MKKVVDLIAEKKQAKVDRKAAKQAKEDAIDKKAVRDTVDRVKAALEGFNIEELRYNRLAVQVGDRTVFVSITPILVSFGLDQTHRDRALISDFEEKFANFIVEGGLV